MPIPRPVHIEAHDPKFYAFRRETYAKWVISGIFTLIAGYFLGSFGVALSLIIWTYLLFSTLLRIYHRLQIEQVQHYWETEALFSLYSSLKITHPLPPMRLWAASPDFVNITVSLIKEHQPKLILEIGSGVSTVVSAYALQEQGEGRLISLEHDAGFAQVTADNLRSHHLDHLATVHHAPLTPITLEGASRLWYDTGVLAQLPGSVDLLVVDGPPSGTGELARYPALPLVFDLLSPGAFILADDFMRDDEYTMVNRWLDQFDLTVVKTFANEKGAVILQKKH